MSKTYRIRRTSDCGRENPPCEGAYIKEVTIMDRRSCSLEEANRKELFVLKFGGPSRYGFREIDENNCMAFYKDKVWVIDTDIEEFARKYGPIVVTQLTDCIEYPIELEIYDDYRE